MEKSKIQEFTLRISQSNRSQLVVILYEMFFTYLEDAKFAIQQENKEEFRKNVKLAQPVLWELMEALDFKYPISTELMNLYRFVNKTLNQALFKLEEKELEVGILVMKNLYTSFVEVSKTDSSPALMGNTQQLYAGLTYGKGSLNENFQDSATGPRGFFV